MLWSTFKNPFVNVYVSKNAHNVDVPRITHAASVATLKALFKQGQGNKRVQCEWDDYRPNVKESHNFRHWSESVQMIRKKRSNPWPQTREMPLFATQKCQLLVFIRKKVEDIFENSSHLASVCRQVVVPHHKHPTP